MARPGLRFSLVVQRGLRIGVLGLLMGLSSLVFWGFWRGDQLLVVGMGKPAGLFSSFQSTPVYAQTSEFVDLLGQGEQAYEQGRWRSALDRWQQALVLAQRQADLRGAAQVLSNLSLGHQQLGEWEQARLTLQQSLQVLETADLDSPADPQIRAQVLNTQGHLWAGLGQFEQALGAWQQAEYLYRLVGDQEGQIGSQLNQAQALQSLGLYRRALQVLSGAVDHLQQQPDSPLKAAGLRSLGHALQLVRNPILAQETLGSSLAVAQRLDLPEQIDRTRLSLGNTAQSLGQPETALAYYQQASRSSDRVLSTQAQLNQLRLWVEQGQLQAAQALWPQIQIALAEIPPSHATIYARINLSQSLLILQEQISDPALDEAILALLTLARQQAQTLQDPRAESYSLGQLGTYLERQTQWQEASALTEAALVIAHGIQATDIAYLWHWQLGRIYRQVERRQEALSQYRQAVQALQSLRSDLVTVNPEVQFSFRDSVEPIYRQLVSLLLEEDPVPPAHLVQARELIESLQLAELDNFFRDACLDSEPSLTPVQLDQVDPRAAVVYPILLPERMEVILSLPDRPLQRHQVFLPQGEIEATLSQFRQALETRTNRQFLPLSQQLYDWLIRPAASDLADSGVDTLVFVLDGPWRNVPMAALEDGQQFLIESYSLALTPGLQLLDPQPLQREQLQALIAGLTEARQGFAPLINVEQEINQIQDQIQGLVLKDPEFTNQRLRNELQSLPFPIVHIATHGQFSSRADDTFILTWDDRLDIPQLDGLLRLSGADQGVTGPIELLTLSACQTATGDNRAALGLAGVAVRAGARSTVASLWYVNDQATVPLISQFYEALTDPTLTKAQALQRAQQQLLSQAQYRHPIYWAPFILVGNWL